MNDERTLFKRVEYDVDGLLHYIDDGDIGLPDIQRPFVWTPKKVRDLFDSMYRGFPVGYLLFWANANGGGTRSIGPEPKTRQAPNFLIVDGQQRLTSLYSVFRRKPVVGANYKPKRIEIAFRPGDARFEVTDAAIRKDPEFVPDISELLASRKSSWGIVNDFLKRLEAKRQLTDEEREAISRNLDRLCDLGTYPFTGLEISASVDEEHVADIFVRINSEGINLNQADFILTLLSVFGEDLRVELERFSRESRTPPPTGAPASPFNHFIEPTPDQLIRVAAGLAFYRGRLRSVYQVLRGKDLATGQFSAERREEQFARLRDNQAEVLNLKHWHRFFDAMVGAGFRSGHLVSSDNTLLFAYAVYLIGRTRFQVSEKELDRLVGRWFYASTLSGRYTAAPETSFERDLNLINALPDGDAFVAALERVMRDTLTGDFWSVTLPNDLETSSARSPAFFAFCAAQNKLNARVLFSDKRIGDLLNPSVKPKRSSLERHHLFPRAWLESQGVTNTRLINQAANFSLLEWPENLDIGGKPPSEYVPEVRRNFSSAAWEEMSRQHALPEGWEKMQYEEFLERRRVLMAQIIHKGFEALS